MKGLMILLLILSNDFVQTVEVVKGRQGGQTDGRDGGQTDGRTDERTNERKEGREEGRKPVPCEGKGDEPRPSCHGTLVPSRAHNKETRARLRRSVGRLKSTVTLMQLCGRQTSGSLS